MIMRSSIANVFVINNIEQLLRKSLPYFFIIVLITTVVGTLLGYLGHNSWKMGDWLINYQGGMVRRGFLGEIIYQLAQLTHINPGFYVIVFQCFFYSVFLFFSYALLKKQHSLLPYTLLIFSPFIFTFQINDLQGGFRKEIIYFSILAYITWSASMKEYKSFEKIFYITLLFYPVVILTHEMLAIFLPYLLVVYLSVTTLNRKKFFWISLLTLPSVVSFIASIYFYGTALQEVEIFNSIARENYTIKGGAISWLDRDSSFGFEAVLKRIHDRHYLYYFFLVVGISLLAYIPVYKTLKVIVENRLSFLLVLVSIVGSSTLFVVAVDWGRFIYIHLVSIFFLSLTFASQKVNVDEDYTKQSVKRLKISSIIFFMVYSLSWHIPHTFGSPLYAKSYKKINVVVFREPYKKIYEYFFQTKVKL